MTINVTSNNVNQSVTLAELIEEAGSTSWVRVVGSLSVQICGDATAIDATLIRLAGSDSEVEVLEISGDPSAGIFENFQASGVGLWKVEVNSIDNTATVYISGSSSTSSNILDTEEITPPEGFAFVVYNGDYVTLDGEYVVVAI